MALSLSTSLRGARAQEVIDAIGNAGVLRIYSGSRPANVAAAITGTLLAELTCGSPFGTQSNGVITAGAITEDPANASGTATHFRVFTSGGTAVLDGDVGTSSSDLNLVSTTVVATEPVRVTSCVLTEGGA